MGSWTRAHFLLCRCHVWSWVGACVHERSARVDAQSYACWIFAATSVLGVWRGGHGQRLRAKNGVLAPHAGSRASCACRHDYTSGCVRHLGLSHYTTAREVRAMGSSMAVWRSSCHRSSKGGGRTGKGGARGGGVGSSRGGKAGGRHVYIGESVEGGESSSRGGGVGGSRGGGKGSSRGGGVDKGGIDGVGAKSGPRHRRGSCAQHRADLDRCRATC